MLSFLRISGLALIESLELPLGPGFTVVTGETGAGKSIIVDALGLLRGGRARSDLVRTGCKEAQVEAVWSLRPDDPRWRSLAEAGRSSEGGEPAPEPAPDEDAAGAAGDETDEGLLVRRVLPRSGKGRIYLGGSLATAAELAETVGGLIDITSQHDQQSLMDPESQLAIVDAFAQNGELLSRMEDVHRTLSHAESEVAAFEADARTRAEREDFLRFQIRELEEANLVPGEDEALRAERERVRGAEKFLAAAARGEQVLYSAEAAAVGMIGSVARELEILAPLDAAFGAAAGRLFDAQAVVEDVARELGRYASTVRFDPQRLEQIEERLYLLGRLMRKHGGSLEAAIASRDQLARSLSELAAYEDSLGERRQILARAREQADALAVELGQKRRQVARGLGRAIDETLQELGLKGARVLVEVEDRGNEGLGPKGRDRVCFQFAPNAGEPPRPLAKIASGGELSRVMLAVKQALARADRTLTYVFDEVDTGVGGAVAEVIGLKLRAIAAERQVLAVTHLPQIAAHADRHLRVEKVTDKGRTFVRVRDLELAEREEEIARMLGGIEPTPEAAEHARQMLRRARGARLQLKQARQRRRA
ncbi:MAG: DNA repair protein RecN [Myxococcales bacterium]|nr:DNA repair protein RecN [Myxococcales bacterium]